MKPPTVAGRWAFGLAALALAADQASKAWILGLAAAGGERLPLAGPLRLTLVQNTGISYGLLQGALDWKRWALAAFAMLVSAGLAAWCWRAEKPLTGVGLGLVLGGALGNVADRVLRGAVVDFVDARALHFPWIFNLADSAITVGVIILLAEGLIVPARRAS